VSWVAAVRAASKSPALLATSAFALGGIGFAVAQLLLAKALPPNEFAIISLVLAINQIGSSAGTLGIEVPINRHRIPATRALLSRTIAFAAPIAAISGIIGAYGYGIGPIVGLLTCATIIASSANMVASALYRSTRQFVPGLLLTQLQNYALLAIAGVALIILSPSAAALTAMIAIAYGAGASVGWMALLRRDAAAPQSPPSRVYITEGLFTLGFNIAAMVMVQFERLIIPRSLTMNDLAVFSVAAALAASPFRMLQIGVGYTLLPRLRACQNVAQIKMLLIKEAVFVAVSTVALIGIVWLVTPQVLAVFLKGRYHLSDALLVAIFAVGTIRIVSAFAVSCVQALGHKKQFRQLTIWSWLSVAASLGGASVCSRFGLEGIVYGVGAGWLLLTLVASLIASSLIRARDAASVN
jgi:O-antigen/teichoic acid export membrane protein